MQELMALSTINQLCHGEQQGADVHFQFVSTDSRSIMPGELFVALQGENFDGHDYVNMAAARGAVAALVSRTISTELPIIKVPDTRIALGQLAAFRRAQVAIPLVAITGSSGKTTTKEMLASILTLQGATLATRGNLNNDIGVPLTLLRLTHTHRFAVIEMGANHPGEIAYTAHLAKPQVALITNVAPAHLAGFGSMEGVLHAKSEIFSALPNDGIAIINADDSHADFWRKLLHAQPYFTFGLQKSSDYTAYQLKADDEGHYSFILRTPKGENEIHLPLMGKHNVMNALAAAAAAEALGVNLTVIKQGLEAMQSVHGRLQSQHGIAGIKVIDDTYNANPGSVKAALELLAHCSGQRVFIVGDMGELGEHAEYYHRLIGQQARELGIEKLYACGKLTELTVETFGHGGQYVSSQEELIKTVRSCLQADMTILVKGSRSAKMEHVVAALVES